MSSSQHGFWLGSKGELKEVKSGGVVMEKY